MNDGVGLVLSGGGAKGAYQVGVVKCLARMGVRVSAVAGASVGALNGALVCSSANLSEAAGKLESIWLELARVPPAEVQKRWPTQVSFLGVYLTLLIAMGSAGSLPSMVLAAEAIFSAVGKARGAAREPEVGLSELGEVASSSGASLATILDRHLRFDDLSRGIPLYLSVFRSRGSLCDLAWAIAGASGLFETPDSVFFHIQSLPVDERKRLILASAALPLLFEAQVVRGELYSDGGIGGWLKVQGNTPITPLLRNTACKVVIVEHLSDGSLWNRHDFPDVSVIELRPKRISRKGGFRDTLAFEPETIEEWIAQGYDDTKAQLGRVVEGLDVVARGRRARQQRSEALQALGYRPDLEKP